VDNITGVSSIAVNGFITTTAPATVDTLNAADSIVLSGTHNELNITHTGAANTDATNNALISGVQTVNIRNASASGTGTVTLLATKIASLTTVNSNLSTDVVTVTDLAVGASAGVIGNGAVTNGAFNAGYVAAATAAIVNVSGGTTAGAIVVSGTGLTSTTVNSTGAANIIGALTLAATTTALTVNATTALTTGTLTNTTAAALTTLTVSGAGAVVLGAVALEGAVNTINASTNSGGLTVLLGTLATQTVIGGSGNDVITTGGVLTTGSVDAGLGTNTLVLRAVGDANTASLAAKYTNFDTLRLAGTFDASLIAGITAIELTGASTVTNLTATQAAAVQARANIGATTLTLAAATGTSDILTITNGLGTTDAAATTIATLTATGFETINLVANPGPTATVGINRTSTITAIADTSLTAVNLTGTAWTLGDIASTKAVTWTATALTGNGAATPVGLTLTTTGAAFVGSIVNGSEFSDSVIMTTSTGVTFNLAGGNDVFSTTSALLLPSGATTDNNINGGTGIDQLVITNAALLTDTSFTKVTGFETLQLQGGALNTSVTGLGAGFLGAYATGVTVTDSVIQSTAQTFTWNSGLYAQNVTLTHATEAVGVASTANQSITTGGGNDTITLTAASFTGATQGQLSVSTGAGNDTIVVTTSTLSTTATAQAVTITGGTGADIINVTHTNGSAVTGLLGNIDFVVAAGDSTTTAYDQITGFKVGVAATTVSDGLDLTAAVLTPYAATAASGHTAAELTVAVAAAGAVTFAGTLAATLTIADKIAAVASVVVTNNGDSAFFTDSGNTYIFNNETAGDVVVDLISVTGVTALITTNAAAATSIFIH